jgi:hypothetical protein
MKELAKELEKFKNSVEFDRRLVESAPLILNLSPEELGDADSKEAIEKTKQIVNQEILRRFRK